MMKKLTLLLLLNLFSISVVAQQNCGCPELYVESSSNYPIVLRSLCSMQLSSYKIIANGTEISMSYPEDNWFNTPYFYMGITPENGFSFKSDDFIININGNNCHYVNGVLGITKFVEINPNESFSVFTINGKFLGVYLKNDVKKLGFGIYILKNEKYTFKIII